MFFSPTTGARRGYCEDRVAPPSGSLSLRAGAASATEPWPGAASATEPRNGGATPAEDDDTGGDAPAEDEEAGIILGGTAPAVEKGV